MTQEEIQSTIRDIEHLTRKAARHFVPENSDALHEERVKYYQDFDEADIEKWIADAKNGNAFAESFLISLATVRLEHSAVSLDKWLGSLLRKRLKPRRRRGRSHSSPMRDSFVAYAVSRARERHPKLGLTKGRHSKTEASVCSIVSEAMAKAGHPLTEGRVKEIWTSQQRHE